MSFAFLIQTHLHSLQKKNRLQSNCKRFNEYVCQKLSMVQSLEELAEQLVDAIAALVAATKQPIEHWIRHQRLCGCC